MKKPKLPANIKPLDWIGPDDPGFQETGLIHTAHIPKSASMTNLAPAVIMVHGKAGDESVMWIFKQAIPAQIAVIAPRAPLSYQGPEGGFVWFESTNGPIRPNEESLQAGLTKLEHFIRAVPYLYPIDPDRLVLIGFSQGAAMSSTYVLNHPERTLGIASLAGAMVQPHKLMPAPSLENLPVFIGHGTEDETISLELARSSRDHYQSLNAEVTYNEYNTGHKITTQGLKDLKTWLAHRFNGTAP